VAKKIRCCAKRYPVAAPAERQAYPRRLLTANAASQIAVSGDLDRHHSAAVLVFRPASSPQ
jgi:hypothetical protein